jgi:hypothetical protein
MVSQVMTVLGEAFVACEIAFGAALLFAWAAIEVIGYGGLLYRMALKQQWIALQRPAKPANDIRWGTVVRAAGFQVRAHELRIQN